MKKSSRKPVEPKAGSDTSFATIASYIVIALISAYIGANWNKLPSFVPFTADPQVQKPQHDIHDNNRFGAGRPFTDDKEIKFKTKVYLEPESHPNKNIRGLPYDLSSWEPGAMGAGVLLYDMSPKEAAKRKEMFKKHAFEEYVSELVSLDRSLPDWRDPWCENTYGQDTQRLPRTSIIICFHNEAWSTLLRSVHSIINRTPEHLIEEILLVDDASTMDHLGSRLDEYVKRFPKVKILRQPQRQGLMRSRLAGISASKGEVLTFLDSHIEAGKGWLEPLLTRVHEDPKVIISPVIDAINDTTFYYTFIEKDIYGLMNWKMEFEWHELSPEQRAAKVHLWAPHENPIMSGGLFAINRNWFEEIGLFDEGMETWGGENLEVSFKAWMCGGRIEISPCSRVGHVFRTFSPYKVDTNQIHRNFIRVARVWLDEFQYLFYERLGHLGESLADRLGDFGDISERKQLRERLQCHNFRWFLDNVVKGALPYHDLIGAGEIGNPSSGMCIDKNDRTELMDHPVDLYPCHDLGGNQYWWLNKNRFLLRDYMCIGVASDQRTVIVTHCGRAGPWIYDSKNKQFKHRNKCLTAILSSRRAELQTCKADKPEQVWTFSRYKPSGLKYTDMADPA